MAVRIGGDKVEGDWCPCPDISLYVLDKIARLDLKRKML